MDSSHYLHMQLRLEGKCLVGNDRLRQVKIVPDEDMPLMLIAQLADRQIVAYFDEALQSELHTELTRRIHNVAFPKIDPLLDFLKTQDVSFEVGHYKTYLFPSHFVDLTNHDVVCRSRQDPEIQTFGFGGFAEQVYTLERDGKIVSACVSTRENGQCGEAWVYTDPQYRNHGFAQQVVGTWAQHMIKAGKVPFYSHKMENIASANLANRLGLQPVFEEISISYTNV